MRFLINQLNEIFQSWADLYPMTGAVIELPHVFLKMDEYTKTYFTETERRSIDSIDNMKRRVSRVAGRLAVRQALSKFDPDTFSINAADQCEIQNDIHGKPFLTKHSSFHISISHAGSLAIAVVSTRKSGVDIEKIEERPVSFARYFFEISEQDWIHQNTADYHQRVNCLWTRKEAASKLLGIGGAIPFRTLAVLDHESSFTFHSHIFNQYCISLALHKESQI